MGTKTPLILSASRCIGAFDPWASSTRCEICASAVSLPTLVAWKRNEPLCVDRRADDLVARPLGDGQGLACDHGLIDGRCASDTTPSTGTFSPGRTTTTSPDAHVLDRDVVLLATP